MKPDRAIAQVLAAVAVIALLAIGSAVYTVAGGALDIDTIAVVADAGTSNAHAQARSTP